MSSNKSSLRTVRSAATTVIPVGAMPRTRAGFFGGERLGPLGVLCCVVFCAAAAGIMDFGVLPPPYTPYARAPLDFNARVPFNYVDSDEINIRREDAVSRATRVYVEDADWVEKILGDLEKLKEIVEKADSQAQAAQMSEDLSKKAQFSQDAYLYKELLAEMFNSKKEAQTLNSAIVTMRNALRRRFNEYAILSEEDYKKESNKREPRELIRVSVVGGKETSTKVLAKDYLRLEDALNNIKRDCTPEMDGRQSALQRKLSMYLDSNIRPALKYDLTLSEKKQKEELERLSSGEMHVEKGDVILQMKTQIIRQSTLEKLRQEHRAVKAKMSWLEQAKRLAGLAAFAGGVLAVFLVVAGRVEPELWKRGRALVMLGLFSLGALAICRGLLVAGFSLAFAPFVFVGMAASLAFGQIVALLTLLALSLLAACASVSWESVPIDGGLPFLSLALLAGGMVAALPAEKLRDRWDLLRYGVLGGLLQGSLVAGCFLLNSEWLAPGAVTETISAPWPRTGMPVLTDALIAYCNGPIYGLLLLGSLPLIESLFGILTNIRLFELADMNQPALQLIQLEAPGTFAHTLQVRFLAEPASDAIGAHTRLVSAGVLYHDLGKTRKPEYFVENTPEAEARHKRLKPSVSALLIISHVKDGIDLAHEFKLPQQIVDFIPEHHGTTLVSYFYHSAVRDAAKEAQAEGETPDGTEVEEAFFRYPGPKPQTRETAIVMLADTIEAASRTLQSPSATRLRQFVHELIMDKMLDNQLDECGLTFADLALVEDAFLRVLATRFHSRIRYPGQEEDGMPELIKEKEDEHDSKK